MNAQTEAWLIKLFGSYERAVELASYYILEYEPLEVKTNEDGTLTATQVTRIRRRTKEEREEFLSYSD